MNRRLDECKMVKVEIDEARHRFYSDLIHRHCADCSECARYLEQTDRLIQLVSGYRVTTPADFDHRLFKRVAELKENRHWLDKFIAFGTGLRLAGGAVAASLLVFGVYSASIYSRLPLEKPSPVAVELKLPTVAVVEGKPVVEEIVQPPSEVVVSVEKGHTRGSRVTAQDIRFVMSDGKTELPVSTVVIGAKPVVDVRDVIQVSEASLSEDAAIF